MFELNNSMSSHILNGLWAAQDIRAVAPFDEFELNDWNLMTELNNFQIN